MANKFIEREQHGLAKGEAQGNSSSAKAWTFDE